MPKPVYNAMTLNQFVSKEYIEALLALEERKLKSARGRIKYLRRYTHALRQKIHLRSRHTCKPMVTTRLP